MHTLFDERDLRGVAKVAPLNEYRRIVIDLD